MLAEASLFTHKYRLLGDQGAENTATSTLHGTALAESHHKRIHIGYLTTHITTCGMCACDFEPMNFSRMKLVHPLHS